MSWFEVYTYCSEYPVIYVSAAYQLSVTVMHCDSVCVCVVRFLR